MTDRPFSQCITAKPVDFDDGAKARAAERLQPALDALPPDAKTLLLSVCSLSPFLAQTAERQSEALLPVFAMTPAAWRADLLTRTADAGDVETIEVLKKKLRRLKQEAALFIALADAGGVWGLSAVTGALTAFADACVSAAIAFLARDAGLSVEGFTALAMGKMGAYELNYSSDIDLILLYDAQVFAHGHKDPAKLGIRLGRKLVDVLQDQTEDGYVFRTDLRLRPDPGGSALVISVDMAERYYEGLGQNWERAAFIKARAVGGDIALGEAFLQRLRPFVWRKYLDYAAIEDIKAIKRQIHSGGRFSDIAEDGGDVKLGRGGIREIEFFVQTQQLILGGRMPEMRVRATMEGLSKLTDAKVVEAETADDLRAAYAFLRQTEHRLQMVADDQTHRLPRTDEEWRRLACFNGFAEAEAFREALAVHMTAVAGHYDDLFADEAPLSVEEGSLVFTGVDNDPDTLKTLLAKGFQRPEGAAALIRGWHAGSVRATRSPRAREVLTRLMPSLVAALAKTDAPDLALARFDSFLRGLPGGVQVFSLFQAKPDLLEDVVKLLGLGPRFGAFLANHPHVIDSMLGWNEEADAPSYTDLFSADLAAAPSYEEKLDAARRCGREAAFQIAAGLARGRMTAEAAARAFSALADAAINALAPVALAHMAEKAGAIEGDFAVIAMGKLGGRELSATSDLDLLCLYDAPPGAASDGARPLDANAYFTRVIRRFVAALSAQTSEGVLYEIDMQLRPSGGAGPTAVRLSAFDAYFEKDAWTWEHMALTRARVVYSTSPAFAAQLEARVRAVLHRKRELAPVAADAHDMRLRLQRERPGRTVWDVKLIRGGLIDIEFIAQVMQLVSAKDHPAALRQNTAEALQALPETADFRETDRQNALADLALMQTVQHFARLAQDGLFNPDEAGEGFWDALGRAVSAASRGEIETRLAEAQRRMLNVYAAVIESHAGK